MNVLFVPSIGLDPTLLERLAATVDYPIKYKVAFNNGQPGALDSFWEKHQDWIVKESHIGNMGVAGSWNYCSEWFSSEPQWLLMNEDAYFLPGYLEKICKCAESNLKEPLIHLNSSNAYYCFVWSLKGKEEYGSFDQNLWPAYYEDCDMRIRHRLKGYNGYVYALEGLPPLPHGKPRTGGINYSAMLQGCGLLNRKYWLTKWGSLDYEKSEYQTPYRDHRLDPKDWVWNPRHRAELYPLWRTFTELPNPSIYD